MIYKRYSNTVILVLIMILIMTASGSGISTSQIDYETLLKNAYAVNSGLETFKSTLKINTRFMGINFPLQGRLYFRRPDQFRLIIPMIPPALKARQGLFQEAVPKSFNPADYNGKITRRENLLNKAECYVVELIPKEKGNISKINLWIDQESRLALQTKIFYEKGGDITSTQTYRKEESFILPHQQLITFNFPGFAAATTIEYAKYEINIPIDDILPEKK